MQGKKVYQEGLFTNFQLSEFVPKENFYRRLTSVLNLDFLYSKTKNYYGYSGQKSIDPIVFFKLCLVGYLENLISDRKLVEHSGMRMDIRYFLGYDIDEPLPWHSTISRTRQLFPEAIFEEVFSEILHLCVEAGMVSGHTQAIDAAPIKANASMDSLELKVPVDELEDHLRKVRYMSTPDRLSRKAKNNKASNEQQLKGIKSRNKKWKKDQDERPGAKNNNAKYTSNKTHYSPTDPDARISVKPGKARKLNFSCQMAVDIANHVVTHIGADFADKKDNQCLQDVTLKLKKRLHKEGLLWHTILADTAYSSGENYAFLEDLGLDIFIPLHGTYKGGPEGFVYDKQKDHWICPEQKIIPFKKVFHEKKNNTKKREYRASKHVCKGCPIQSECLKSAQEKKFTITYYREEYERVKKRIKSKRGRYMKSKRQSTVEPVFGTLTQFMGLRKINTIGIKQANKCMLLSGMAYNLKKYLKFTQKSVETKVESMRLCFFGIKDIIRANISLSYAP